MVEDRQEQLTEPLLTEGDHQAHVVGVPVEYPNLPSLKVGKLEWIKDPVIVVRFLTGIRGAIAMVILSTLIFIDQYRSELPRGTIILGCTHLAVMTQHATVMGVLRMSYDTVLCGVVITIYAIICVYIGTDFWFRLVCVGLYCFAIGLYDPKLLRPQQAKFGGVGITSLLLASQYQAGNPDRPWGHHDPWYYPVTFFLFSHLVPCVLLILCALFIFPILSSRQFLKEGKHAMKYCRALITIFSVKSKWLLMGEGEYDEETQVKQINRLQYLYTKKMNRMKRLQKEARWETFLPPTTFTTYERIIDNMERLFQLLMMGIDASSQGKFSPSSHDAFRPLFPHMNSLNNATAYHLASLEETHMSSGYYKPLTPPLSTLADLSRKLDENFVQIAKEREVRGEPELSTDELTRMSQIVFGSTEFLHLLQNFEGELAKFGQGEGIPKVIFRYMVNELRRLTWKGVFDWAADPFVQVGLMLKYIWNTSIKEVWDNTRWHFAFRTMVGIMGLAALFHLVPEKYHEDLPVWEPSWSYLTFFIVSVPNLGVTIRRGVHRFCGTCLGAGGGTAILLLIYASLPHMRLFVYAMVTFCYFVISISLQQIPWFSYTGTVTGVTYLVIILNQIDSNPHIPFGLARALFIAMGVVWGVFINSVIFPQRASIKFNVLLIDFNAKVTLLFASLLDKATDRDSKHTALEQAGKAAKAAYSLLKIALKESKSELIPISNKYKLYYRTLKRTYAFYRSVLVFESLVLEGFSDSIYNSIITLISTPIRELGPLMVEYADHMNSPHVKTKHGFLDVNLKGDMNNVLQNTRNVSTQYLECRESLQTQNALSSLHPEIRQANLFIYSLHAIILSWVAFQHNILQSFQAVEPSFENEEAEMELLEEEDKKFSLAVLVQ